MKYILEGNDKELERVIKESRVRVNRGLISITPFTECGLITEEGVRKTLDELAVSLEEKDTLISALEEQCEELKTRIVDLENRDTLMGDDKGLQEADLTALTVDIKELALEDKKGNSTAKSETCTADSESTGKDTFNDDPDF